MLAVVIANPGENVKMESISYEDVTAILNKAYYR